MELTPLRWITIAVAVCTVVFYALVGAELKSRPRFRPYGVAGADTTLARLEHDARTESIRHSALMSQYRYRQLFDSIDAVAARDSAPGMAVRAYYDAAIPATTRSELAALFGRATTQLKARPMVGIDVYFVFDTTHVVRGNLRGAFYGTLVNFRLPTVPGERCTVLVRMNRFPSAVSEIQRVYHSQTAADQLLGPCAFYRAFGFPGRGVAAWMTGGGWAIASEASWARAPARLDAIAPQSRYFAGPSPAFAYLGAGGLRCASGEVAKCQADLIALGSDTPIITTKTTALTRSNQLSSFRYALAQFGMRGPQMMSAMVRSLGDARFRMFWLSDGDVATSFAKAAGVPPGVWVARWMSDQYGTVERGPRPAPLGVVWGMALAFAALAAALWASERKALS